MYRRPILCTLHGAVDFLKLLKIAVVGGGGCYWDIVHILYDYIPVDDGRGQVLGCNVYITSQYWDVMYTLHPSTSLQMPNIELHRPGIEPRPPCSTIELWNLYIIWVC
jgi:hypothetical protein